MLSLRLATPLGLFEVSAVVAPCLGCAPLLFVPPPRESRNGAGAGGRGARALERLARARLAGGCGSALPWVPPTPPSPPLEERRGSNPRRTGPSPGARARVNVQSALQLGSGGGGAFAAPACSAMPRPPPARSGGGGFSAGRVTHFRCAAEGAALAAPPPSSTRPDPAPGWGCRGAHPPPGGPRRRSQKAQPGCRRRRRALARCRCRPTSALLAPAAAAAAGRGRGRPVSSTCELPPERPARDDPPRGRDERRARGLAGESAGAPRGLEVWAGGWLLRPDGGRKGVRGQRRQQSSPLSECRVRFQDGADHHCPGTYPPPPGSPREPPGRHLLELTASGGRSVPGAVWRWRAPLNPGVADLPPAAFVGGSFNVAAGPR